MAHEKQFREVHVHMYNGTEVLKFEEAKVDSSHYEYFITHRTGVERIPRNFVRRINCRSEE